MIRVETPSRLHFGLLSLRARPGARLGGVGVMVDGPGVAIRVSRSDRLGVSGPLSNRAAAFARQCGECLGLNVGDDGPAVRIQVDRAAGQHVGLGTGTQLGMALAKALAIHHDADDERTMTLAGQIGRGQRSAVGITGFETGGLVVDMGDSGDGEVFGVSVPEDWRFVLISPAALSGINGRAEERAFRKLHHLDDDPSEELKEMVTNGLLPALADGALEAFGEALFVLQQRVGASYASVQGGVYADPFLERIVEFVRGCGASGVGQSSWGPTLYAVVDGEAAGGALATEIRSEYGLSEREVRVVGVCASGARVTVDSDQGALKAPRVGLA